MNIAVWFYRRFGKRLSGFFILPIVAYFLLTDPHRRAASRQYLARLYAQPEGRVVLRHPPKLWDSFRHYREFGKVILDRVSFALGDIEPFTVHFTGREHFERLIRERRGAILIGAHIGSFDALRLLARRAGIVVNVLMFTAHARQINSVLKRLNPEVDAGVIHVDPMSVQWVFELRAAVRRGEFVAILGDRIVPGNRQPNPVAAFLGHRAAFPAGPFVLAGIVRCPIILLIALRAKGAAYEVFAELLAEHVVLTAGERMSEIQRLVTIYTKRLEAYCFKAPYQWFNFYDFWGKEATLGS